MSAPTETTNTATRIPVLALGLTLVALGISGLLDDTGAIPHPPWTIAVIATIAASATAVTHTVRQLLDSRPDRIAE